MSLPTAPPLRERPMPALRRFLVTLGILVRVAVVLVVWLGVFQVTFFVYLTVPAVAILTFWVGYNLIQAVRRSHWPARA